MSNYKMLKNICTIWSNSISKVSAVGGMVASGGGDKLTIAVEGTLWENKKNDYSQKWRTLLYSFAQQKLLVEWLFDKTAIIVTALTSLVCFSLWTFLEEIRSLGKHLEVVNFTDLVAVTDFYQSDVFKKFLCSNSRSRKNKIFMSSSFTL